MSNVIPINLIRTRNIMEIDFFAGAMKVGDLLDIFQVPVYKAWKPLSEGYQRSENQKRIDDIRNRVLDSPDSLDILVDTVNINIRVKDAEELIIPVDKSKNGYGDFHIFNYIEKYGPAWIVDGQHRIKGLEAAYAKAKSNGDHDIAEKLAEGYINVSVTFTEDPFREAYIFYLVQTHAKSVVPDGAHRLIVEGHNNGDVRFKNEVANSSKINLDDIEAANIADELADKSKTWKGFVKDFNDSGATKLSVRALSKMLKPLYLTVKNNALAQGHKKAPEVTTYEIIEAYWGALQLIFPMMFNPITSKGYGLKKSSQAEVMFRICEFIVRVHITDWQQKFKLKSFGPLTDEKTWVKILSPGLKQTKDQNASGTDVIGPDCWLIGKGGSMGRYTSSAAKRDIATRLKDEIEVTHGITRSQII